MVVTLFRSRLRPEHREEYERWAHRIHNLAAKKCPASFQKTFTAGDGERVSIVESESEEAMRAWREQMEHKR